MYRGLVLLLALVAVVASCKKLETEGEYVPSSTEYNLSAFLAKHAPQSEFIDISTDTNTRDTSIFTSDGVEICFNADSIKNNFGDTVYGDIQIEYNALWKKSDFILAEKQTVANYDFLESAGSFYLKIRKNGEELTINPITLKVPSSKDSIDTDMELFLPGRQPDGRFTWVETTPGVEGFLGFEQAGDTISQDTTGGTYEENKYVAALFNDTLGWMNIDRFSGYNSRTSTFKVVLSETDKELLDNSKVYVVFRYIHGVMEAIKSQGFSFEISRCPNGVIAQIVVVSSKGIDLYGYVSEEFQFNGQPINVKLTETTEAELLEQIKAL